MARSIGDTLPSSLAVLLSDDRFADRADDDEGGLTIVVLSMAPDGWPHPAMISLAEVLAVGPRALRLALWPSSTAAKNVWREQRTTLALVHDGAAYSVRCAARRGSDLVLPDDGGRLACFGLRVDEVIEDVVPSAVLTSGAIFHLNDPKAAVQCWRATRAALRAARFSGE
jgi:hypothetical protein